MSRPTSRSIDGIHQITAARFFFVDVTALIVHRISIPEKFVAAKIKTQEAQGFFYLKPQAHLVQQLKQPATIKQPSPK